MGRHREKFTRIINNYWAIYKPEHPNSIKSEGNKGYVYEHVFVASLILGRPLEYNEDVHHLDFNTQNNLPENLLIMEHGQHRKLHNWIRSNNMRSLFENEETKGQHLVRKCLCCEEYLIHNGKFCNKECQDTYYAEFKHIPVDKNTLEEMTKSMNKVEIAKELNTNRSTVNSWLYDLGLM